MVVYLMRRIFCDILAELNVTKFITMCSIITNGLHYLESALHTTHFKIYTMHGTVYIHITIDQNL